MKPTVLIATTTWYAMPARVAMAFSKAGANVNAIIPPGSPLEKVRSVEKTLHYSSINPLRSLAEAINVVKPDLIIPCDDRVVEHLHRLHAQSVNSAEYESARTIIEKSLGNPSGYNIAGSRARLLRLAEQSGIRIPKTGVIRNLEELKDWAKVYGFPSVLKVDGSWGGSGVRVVHSWEDAEMAFLELAKPITSMAILRCLSLHDFYPLFSRRATRSIDVTIQRYVDGYPANCLLACWEGQVLDGVSVEALYAVDKLGSSTVVHTIENSEMADAGRTLVRALGISGFCGLDFIIEATTGNAYLIEMNPRATQVGHLTPGGRRSLVSTLEALIAGEGMPIAPDFAEDTIAFFPHILRCRPDNPILTLPGLHYDVPWEEPELTRELMRKPWNSRHLSALLYRAIEKLIDYVRMKVTKRLDSEELGPEHAQ